MEGQPIRDMGDAVLVSIAEALRNFLGFLPNLVGAIIILIIGWILAGLVATLVRKALETVGFERAADQAGVTGVVRRSGAGEDWTASRVVAEIVKWFIRLIFLQAAASVLGMPQLTEIINAILLWLPNLVVALVIVVVGALIAKLVAGIVRGSTAEMGLGNPDLIAGIARYAIIAFAVVAAINQLGIAPVVANTLYIATIGAIAAALALAFGLGGRDVAADMTRNWYTKGQEASDKIGRYAERRQTDRERVQAAGEPAPSTTSVEPSRERQGQRKRG